MKTKIIVFVLLLFINYSSYTQIIKGIGFKSGVILSNQSWEKTFFYESQIFNTIPGFYGVITTDFIYKKNWDLSLDLGFFESSNINKTNVYSYFNTVEFFERPYRINFITISPLLKFKTKFKSFTPYILIAPRMDIHYSNTFDYTINSPIWGFNIGEGVSYEIKKISLFAEYQFMYCFNYFFDQPPMNPNKKRNDKLKVNSHIISLGIKYCFKTE